MNTIAKLPPPPHLLRSVHSRFCSSKAREMFLVSSPPSSHHRHDLHRGNQIRRCLSSYPSSPNIVGPPPRLFDLVLQKRFDAVLERARSHPHEARYGHPRRWTALHACVESGAPPDVLREVVGACPESLAVRDWRGNLPIDLAVTEELRQFMESVGDAVVVGGEGEDDRGSPVAVATEEDGNTERIVDCLGARAANLTAQCQALEAEVVRLREALRRK